MRLPGSFQNFTVNTVDGTVFQVSAGKLKSTGFLVKEMTLPISGAQPARAFCLDLRQMDYAVEAWKAAFQGGQVSIVDHATVESGGITKLTGGGPAYADEWIVVNDKVAINPLALRLLSFAKKDIRAAFEHELQANGLLADLV